MAVNLESLDLQLVSHDGTVRTFSGSWDAAAGTATVGAVPVTTPWISPGLRMDGRAGDASGDLPPDAAWSWSTADAAQRPRLLRLRFTLREPSTSIVQVFSHSFLLPALAGTP
jgi:hypothetical protein